MRLAMKGQMEMIGLVFVVVIIVLGMFLYLRFSDSPSESIVRTAKEVQLYTSFLTALSETDVPDCGVPVSRVAAACLEDDADLCGGTPCEALNNTINTIAEATLKRQGIRYDLRLEGTAVQAADRCNITVTSSYSPSIPIVTPSGIPGKITLTVCR
jgi:hypothetical protein